MTVLEFRIDFHSAFRVAGAYARDGIDLAPDAEDPLPADSLKGVMRAAADTLLGPAPLVAEVFGRSGHPCAWAWTGAELADGRTWEHGTRHRVAIDPVAHAARADMLVTAGQTWADHATFEIQRVAYLDADVEARHLALLRVSAGAVHGLGGWRRRGLGWVHITPVDGAVTADDVAQVLGSRAAATAEEVGA